MVYLTTNYQIASGNDNAAGLTAITALTDGSNTFVDVLGLPSIMRGSRETLANGTTSRRGFQSQTWVSDLLIGQYWYLVENYEGLVTVKSAISGTTWANYNGVLTLQDPSEMTYVVFAASDHEAGFQGPGFRSARWMLTRLESL